MSVQALTWVLEHSRAEHSARLVAIALANHAGTDGGDAYPSIATIAREARLGESTARAALEQLKDLGEIVEVGVSHLRTRLFMFPLEIPAAVAAPADTPVAAAIPEGADSGPPAESAPPQNLAAEGADSGPKPSITNEEREIGPARAICDRIEQHISGLGLQPADGGPPAAWLDEAQALLDDGQQLPHVLAVLDWIGRDAFWSGRIVNPAALRRNFGQIAVVRAGAAAIRSTDRATAERQLQRREEQRQSAGACCLAAGGAPTAAEDEWRRLAPELREVLGAENFERWLTSAHAHTGGDGEMLLALSPVVEAMVRDRFGLAIDRAADRRLEIVVCDEAAP